MFDNLLYFQVEMEDKPVSFRRSKQWIGAIEVSLCMQHFFDCSCRVIHVRSGTEIVDAIPQLAAHFRTGGGPVMIGGGVKAFTIIGVKPKSDEVTNAYLSAGINLLLNFS